MTPGRPKADACDTTMAAAVVPAEASRPRQVGWVSAGPAYRAGERADPGEQRQVRRGRFGGMQHGHRPGRRQRVRRPTLRRERVPPGHPSPSLRVADQSHTVPAPPAPRSGSPSRIHTAGHRRLSCLNDHEAGLDFTIHVPMPGGPRAVPDPSAVGLVHEAAGPRDAVSRAAARVINPWRRRWSSRDDGRCGGGRGRRRPS